MANIKKTLYKWLFFQEPSKTEGFILKENKAESEESEIRKEDKEKNNDENTKRKRKNVDLLLNKKDEDKTKEKDKEEEQEEDIDKDKDKDKDKGKTKENKNVNEEKDETDDGPEVSDKLSYNLEYIKKAYYIPVNGDICIREFEIPVKGDSIEAFIVFIDGMADRMVINLAILQPLMLLSNLEIKGDREEVGAYIKKHLLPHNQLKITKSYQEAISDINFGSCALFVDGVDKVFLADVKGWEHRSVERAQSELVIRGPQEGFNEVLRANTALVRKILKDENLVAESISLGKRSKTTCSMLYIRDIANDTLVNEVRRRIKSIKMDYIIDTGELEQMLEDSSFLPGPQIIATERPDRVASLLSEGKVALIMNGSPYALVVPATLTDLLHSPEDAYVRYPYANFFRFVRIIGTLFSLLLPGVYVAITNFHHEMIPTDLLFAISAAREKVPFPSVVEILIMEVAFELIREAGIRIPGPIGPTLGIIGALILGQAAVAANIVSPILIIIVAVTGIGSFAIANFSLALSTRVLRFVYILLGSVGGFLGISLGLFLHSIWFTSAKSFGLPYTTPFGPTTKSRFTDAIIRAPLWKHESRPDYLNTKNDKKQPKISRKWIYKDAEDEDGE